MNPVDLHIHSHHSLDGQFTEADLISQAKEAGLEVMAIADHNSVRAVKAALPLAKAAGIDLIPAIEIDCDFQGINVHLLGYHIDYKDPAYEALTVQILKMEAEATALRIEKTQALGLAISLADFKGKDIIIPEEIAEVLLSRDDAAKYDLLLPYLPGGNRDDNPYVNFYWDYYTTGKPCYVPIEFMSLAEAVDLVKETGGIPIIAHPEKTFGAIAPYLDELVASGVEGLEVYSSYHGQEEVQRLLKEAEARDLLITFGSDYHGKTKPSVSLGMTGCDLPFEAQMEAVRQLKVQA
jgi:hypothetical protein